MKSVHIPEAVYQQASLLAEQDHVSVDRAIAALVRDGLGEWSKLHDRATRASIDKLKSVLGKVGDRVPLPGDEL